MQYDRYEKLIVVDKGVELINWPDEVPFINASDVGSMHTLRKLHDALTISNMDKRCRWVMLSEDEWAKRTDAFHEATADLPPKKRKRKVQEPESDSDSSENGNEAAPLKKVRRTKPSGKENDATKASEMTKKRRKGTGQRKTRGKGSSDKGVPTVSVEQAANGTAESIVPPLAPVSGN
jgi:hypothetical protein